ncbi:uncharacterized protein MONOS_5900 [Monocercomonoides exilis]|uniref:uncharacterized protein n=1 Tax=Monocercomonoides exilis TaxID=2049356 RepID=UPI00355AA5E6|nr:hypothetical protein MONOS_5900 [Monocercomonoides exilis]|eukprot:MONOS_5900.1-p1 / transcript=MONOS_5900.1 / gene=MONOS_5900 / organism=Monocercomonoides_exilis_PA203 / gene_product=unspecified product / transcript_product=unspecified product / location=Mono_scaffold00178:18927-19187(-) / protein_length=87 / sequence_SO=supercontig / SO=protein_coding / is_pseudo=false
MKKEEQMFDSPRREGEEGAPTVSVAQRKFDGRNGADAEKEKIDIFHYSPRVRNTWRVNHEGSSHTPAPQPSSVPQRAMDLLWKQQE